jgi:hypothetical protein
MLRYTVMALVTGFVMVALTGLIMWIGDSFEFDQWVTALITITVVIMYAILTGCVYYYKPRKG